MSGPSLVEHAGGRGVEVDAVARGWLQIALAFLHEAWRGGDLWTGLRMAEAACASFVAVAARRELTRRVRAGAW